MKNISDALAKGWIKKVLFPGVVLAIGLHPYIRPVVDSEVGRQYPLSPLGLFLLEVAALGLTLVAFQSFILRLYQGNQFPKRIYYGLLGLHQKRVERLSYCLRKMLEQGPFESLQEKEKVVFRRAVAKLQDYPNSRLASFEAVKPTLLGNIIHTGLKYPSTRYDVDGIAYWHQLCHAAPSSMRDDYLESQSLGQSFILASFASCILVLVGIVHVGLVGLGSLLGPVLGYAYVPESVGVAVAVFGFAFTCVWYFAAVSAYRDTSRNFQVLTDLAILRVSTQIRLANQLRSNGHDLGAERLRKWRRYLTEKGLNGAIEAPAEYFDDISGSTVPVAGDDDKADGVPRAPAETKELEEKDTETSSSGTDRQS